MPKTFLNFETSKQISSRSLNPQTKKKGTKLPHIENYSTVWCYLLYSAFIEAKSTDNNQSGSIGKYTIKIRIKGKNKE